MTIKASHFTPEALISATRRSAGVPNGDSSLILYTTSRYRFEDQKETSEIRVKDGQWGGAYVIDDTSRASNPVWLDPESPKDVGGMILFLREREGEKEKGVTDLCCSLDLLDNPRYSYVVGTFPGPVSDLKVTRLGDDQYGLAVTGKANPDGTLFNPHNTPKPKTTAKLYKSLLVRHWDTYVTRERKSIFYAALMTRNSDLNYSRFFMTDLVNPLRGTGLESPMPPFGGKDHFDISRNGLVFVARDPDLSPALHTKCNIYLVPLSSFLETTPMLYTVNMGEYKGAMSSPRFSPDGSKVVFLAMREDGYEADRNEIWVIPDISRPAWITNYRGSVEAKKKWDRSPDSVCWDSSGSSLWITADHYGTKQIFHLSSDPQTTTAPDLYPVTGSVSDLVLLPNGNVFASSSSFIDSSIWWLFNKKTTSPISGSTGIVEAVSKSLKPSIAPLSSFSDNGRLFNLNPSQIAYGTIQQDSNPIGYVHVWSLRPSNFDKSKKYPLAILVHGGPQASWDNSWSTRWNPAVFAEQGYVVMMPNPTGSTGFGQTYTDGIQGEWGGKPYEDIVTMLDFFKTIPHLDTDRTVVLGASYGGYMANWIQGQPLGREVKAIVCHDGVFSSSYHLATDELYFTNHEFNGPWNPRSEKSLKEWRKWDPSLHTDEWETPQLTIHSDNDFRLTIADGLATFNILQSKGVESEFLTFSDENHWVQGQENSLRWHEAVLSFINKHVGLPKWERREGDLDDIRMDPDLTMRGSEEGRARVAVASMGDDAKNPV